MRRLFWYIEKKKKKKNAPNLFMFSFVENALISLFIARDSVPLNSVFEVILDL